MKADVTRIASWQLQILNILVNASRIQSQIYKDTTIVGLNIFRDGQRGIENRARVRQPVTDYITNYSWLLTFEVFSSFESSWLLKNKKTNSCCLLDWTDWLLNSILMFQTLEYNLHITGFEKYIYIPPTI